MSVDHLAVYQKMTSNKRYSAPLPDWVRKQRLDYPHYDKHSELIEAYSKAKKQYDESVEVLQSAYQRRWQNPENPQRSESVRQCQQQLESALSALESAEQALRQFNDHTPQQRIELYESEIGELQGELAKAKHLEQNYIQQMLNNPDAAKKRLERMLEGYSGEKAEYSDEQISDLRSHTRKVESIELKILNSQRDIQRIHQLVIQEEHKAQIQATMDAALPKFNKACARLAEAWGELQSLAAEHDIRIVSQHNLQLPTEAKFKQSNSPYEGVSSIHIIFSK